MKLLKKATAAIALVALVSGLFTTGVSAANTAQLEAANYLANKGIVVTKADAAAYALDQSVLRQEIAAVARGVAGLEKSTSVKGTFSDVTATSPNSWAVYSIEPLATAGLISTSNSTFRPEDKISKAEGLGMMVKAAYGNEYSYDDSKSTSWQEQVVSFAVEKGIVSSFTNYDTPATRGWVFEIGSTALSSQEDDSEDDLLGDLLGDLTDDEDDTEDETDTTPVVSGDDKLTITLSPETPKDGSVVVKVSRTPMLAFDVTAGSSDVTLTKANFLFTGLGDKTKVDDVTIYNSKNESVSKTRNFSDTDLELSFDKDTVIKAGETQTLTVAVKLDTDGDENTTYQIQLVDLEASSAVEGGNIKGASLVPVEFSNSAQLKVKEDTASKDVLIGENVELAGFEIEELKDNEDVIIKNITLHLSGSVDEDYVTDLTLLADGEEIASNLTINSDEEVVVNPDYTLAADKRVTFELRGTVTGDVNKTIEFVFEKSDDIYAVGATTGYNVAFDSTFDDDAAAKAIDVAAVKTIEGSEINVSFTKSDIDETKTDKDDVLLGTLKMTALTDDYEVKSITVKVTGTNSGAVALTASGILDTVKEVNLGGTVYDSKDTSVTNEVTYTFEDITLSKDNELVLPLEMDVEKSTTLNGNELTFDLNIVEVEDTENDVTYTSGTLTDVLSTTSFDDKKVKIESATFTLTQVSVNDRTLVLGNTDTIVYKAKVSVGDSDDVTLDDLTLTLSGTIHAGVDLDDIADKAVLNIGGKTYEADINTSTLKFNNINNVLVAGSDDVEVLVTVSLKDDDTLTGTGNNLELSLASVSDITVEDSESDSVETGNLTVATGSTTKTTLRENGKLTVEFDTDEDTVNLTGVDKFVLAGTNSVVLGKVKFDADYENSKVKEIAFAVAGSTDFTNTLKNVRLVSGGATLVDSAKVTFDTATKIVFENEFEIETTGEVEALIVADLYPVTDQGDATSATTGDIELSMITASNLDIEGAVSLDDYSTASGTLIAAAGFTKKATVAANTVAGVTLSTSMTTIAAETAAVIGKLTIDMTNQTNNKNNDGNDIIEALLKNVNIGVNASNVTVSNLKLSRAGVDLAINNGSATDLTADGDYTTDFATIDDGKATFDILADLTAGTDITKATMNIKIADISTGIILNDGTGTDINKVYSSKTSSSDKQASVSVSN